jgi:hypothetical protein
MLTQPPSEEEFPPTREMVERYARQKGWNVDAGDFIARCEAADWCDGSGKPISNWRLWLGGYMVKQAAGRTAMHGVDPRIAALEALKEANK